ncbi:MAG: HEAT repeat domain-containing protein, partial [SAR324 cluster bacterium]|nr:HEAT repeat domain-containing protein [SAR324 cluster bacterium]
QSSHLRRAFETFSSRFASTQPERVQQAARKLLGNPNAQVRISAARALRKLDTASARSSFQRYLGTEKEEWVKQAVQE